MAQAVIPKASLEEICHWGGLIVGGFLASLDINNNIIISRIPNYIPIPSKFRCVVHKAREVTFMRITGFVCNYPCSMSFDKWWHAGLDRLVKKIAFCDGELVKSIWIHADASKGILKEVAKALDVSLNQIVNFWSYGGRTLLIGHKIDSESGVTWSLASGIKNVDCVS